MLLTGIRCSPGCAVVVIDLAYDAAKAWKAIAGVRVDIVVAGRVVRTWT